MTKSVFITGANRGIGLAIARQLAELGNSVLLGSRDLKAGEDAAKSFRRPGLDVEPVHVDLTAAATIDAAISAIEKSGRHVDAPGQQRWRVARKATPSPDGCRDQ